MLLTPFIVKQGDRIAQLVLERVSQTVRPHRWIHLLTFSQIYTPEVSVVEELEESVRGAGGFGSTGV